MMMIKLFWIEEVDLTALKHTVEHTITTILAPTLIVLIILVIIILLTLTIIILAMTQTAHFPLKMTQLLAILFMSVMMILMSVFLRHRSTFIGWKFKITL